MKYFLPTLLTAALLVTFTGCDQAQKALDTIDKAKSLKAEVEKESEGSDGQGTRADSRQ